MEKEKEILEILAEIQKNQELSRERMRRIERNLLGDKEFRVKGFLEQQEEKNLELEKGIKDFKMFIAQEKQDKKIKAAKQTGIIIGGTVASGGLWQAIRSYFGF